MERATFLVYEECRLLKKTIIDSVFQKMAHPRQAKFLSLPEYQTDDGKPLSRWLEECKSIYITSARFKSEWFWTEFKKVTQQCLLSINSIKHKYNIFAGDIFLAILFGLKTWQDYYHAKEFDGDIDHRTEDLNEMIGEADGAFFTLEDFRKNQIIQKAFRPPTSLDLYSNIDLGNRLKKENEKRFIFIDFAFANTTSKSENDNSVIGCLYQILKEDGTSIRGLDYIGTHSAGDSTGFNLKIRELFFDYKADYIVLDIRNGGEVYYNDLTTILEHPTRDEKHWNSHGFTVSYENKLHVVPTAKLDDLKSRTIDPQPIPCIIPVAGTPELNSTMWLELKKTLNNKRINFLIDELSLETQMEEDGTYYDLSSEDKALIKLPYIHTIMLIGEAISLSATWNQGKVKLSEPNTVGSTKDKIVALSYCNYIATLVENKYAVNLNEDTNIDLSQWQLVY